MAREIDDYEELISFAGFNYWIIQTDQFGIQDIVSTSAIPVDDEMGLELAFVKQFKKHPWDYSYTYSLLCISDAKVPTIEEVDEDYIGYIIGEAWGRAEAEEIIPISDEELKQLGEDVEEWEGEGLNGV